MTTTIAITIAVTITITITIRKKPEFGVHAQESLFIMYIYILLYIVVFICFILKMMCLSKITCSYIKNDV